MSTSTTTSCSSRAVSNLGRRGLEEAGYAVNRWTGRNLYFGGASAVAVRADGALEAAGDPRRGGAGVVVAR